MEYIDNGGGITVNNIKTAKFKTESITALMRRPLCKNDATKNALIPRILKRGSAVYPDLRKIKIKMEELDGAVFDITTIKVGEEQIIQFCTEYINNGDNARLDEVLNFLKEIMLNPLTENSKFLEGLLNSEKDSLKKQITGRINDKRQYAKQRLFEMMCANEPFGTYADGYAEDLEKINGDELYKYYKTVLQTSPIEFIITGNYDTKFLADKIKYIFNLEYSGINRDCIIKIQQADYSVMPEKARRFDEKTESAQGKLCIGYRAGVEPNSTDYYALLLMNEIFGGGSDSRLFNNIREKEGLCYYVNSSVVRSKSILLIESGMDEKDFQKSIDLIEKELRVVQEYGVKESELDKSKKFLVKRMETLSDYPAAMTDFYFTQKTAADSRNVSEVIEQIKKITAKDCEKAFSGLKPDYAYTLA